jgi:hypothetical protein
MNYGELVSTISDYTENTFSSTDINTFIEQAELRIYNEIQFPSLRKNVTGTVTPANPYLSAPSDYLSTYSMAVIDSTGSYTYLLNKDVNYIREAYPVPAATGLPKCYAIFGPQSLFPNELTFLLGPTPDTNYTVELHYFFYPPSIIQGQITNLTTAFTAGSGYANGTYYNVPLTGGTGSGATAQIVVSGNAVTSVTLGAYGSGYAVGDSLSAAASSLGGSGSGFVVGVASINNSTGRTWLGDNFDTALLYGALVEAYTFMKGEADLLAQYTKQYMEALAQAKRLGDGLERQDAYRSGQFRQKVE